MKETLLPASACPSCGYKFDAATATSREDATPKEGDLTLCFRCGHLLAFNADLTCRELTGEEMVDAAGNIELIKASTALHDFWKEHNRDRH